MLLNTFFEIPQAVSGTLVSFAKKGLTLSLFFIGASLTMSVLRSVGLRPMIQAIIIWITISIGSLMYILLV